MLAINLAKLTEKFLGFTPYTIVLIMCYTQVCLTVYTVEKITVDVNKMGVRRNAWKKVHLNILLTEDYIHLLGFFLTWAKNPYQLSSNQLQFGRLYLTKQPFRQSLNNIFANLVLCWWLNQSRGKVMESNLVLGRKADGDLVVFCWDSPTFPLKAHKHICFWK